MQVGAIIGIVAGALLFVILVIVLFVVTKKDELKTNIKLYEDAHGVGSWEARKAYDAIHGVGAFMRYENENGNRSWQDMNKNVQV